MQAAQIIQEIQHLPLAKKLYVVQETIKSIQKDETDKQMELAVNDLYEDYVTDKDLTAFTDIDLDGFYETN